MSASQDNFDFHSAPMRIGRMRLGVRDLATVSRFYQDVIGLSVLSQDEAATVLGTAAGPLLELAGDPSLQPRDRSDAGLFHVAFLLPAREDLGRWLAFASGKGVALLGASDHGVSEALYLADPEGNGIEIYADHPPSRWRDGDGAIHMTTERLDAQELLADAAGQPWQGFPDGGCIGHVHLQVGNEDQADRFYAGVLGFEPTTRMRGARFFGSGGYHHQVAANVWNSGGAGRRPEAAAGLAAFGIIVREADRRAAILTRAADAGLPVSDRGPFATIEDPWGTVIELSTTSAT